MPSNQSTENYSSERGSAQTFRAMNGNSAIGNSTNSLFKAIENARSSGYSGARVLMNSSTEVFKISNASTYYMYQFDQYYGSTTSLASAQSWIANYNYSHVIDGTGFAKYDYLQDIKGGLTGTSTNSLIERNKGGYYFNFAKSSSSYKKMSIDVDLSSATAKRADTGSYPDNSYIFVGAKQSYTFETGLIFDGSGTNAVLYPYYMDGHGIVHTQTNCPIAIGTRNASTGVVTFSGNVQISLGIATGKQICEVKNLTTGATWSDSINNSLISGTQSTRFFYTVSSITCDPNTSTLNDLRSGSYFKNIKIKNALVYTSTSSISGTSASPSSSVSQYAFLYNTDCGSYMKSGSGSSTIENISIYYNNTAT